MNKRRVLFIYICSIALVCTCFYMLLKPKDAKLFLPPPKDEHITYLSQYDWHIKKMTSHNTFILYDQLFWVEQYKNNGFDLTPYINQEIERTTYLLEEQEIEEDGNIYMTIYEHEGAIIGAMGRLENWIPGILPVEDKQRLMNENRLK